MLKFEKALDKNGKLVLSAGALELCGFLPDERLELRTSDSLAVITPKQMTAMDIISVVEGLSELAIGLLCFLGKGCGECEDCEHCVLGDDEPTEQQIFLRESLLEKAGIDPEAKLFACISENGGITVEQAEYAKDLGDVSVPILEMIAATGTSLCKLEEHLKKGDIIYGK